MRRLVPGQHRTLLFRSYLFLVAALLSVAAILDFGFGYYESSLAPVEDRWLDSTFGLIETRLAGLTPERRPAVLASLVEQLGIGVQLLEQDQIASTAELPGRMDTLTDAKGNRSYLRAAPSLNGIIRLGPVQAPRESVVLRLLPPLFYLSIFLIVGLWLRPIFRDLNLITNAAQRFAADYREPLSTAARTTQLTGLARHLDDMSARLSGLIQSQKELIAALSHEMRTPLARIRFALAVVGDSSDGDLKRQLGELNADVLEIDELIATMLNYAQLDHPDLRMNWLEVPLEEWLEQVREKSRHPDESLIVVRSHDLDTAWMDPRLMGLAVGNLLGNACRYAKEQVRCRITGGDAGYTIEVEDDGPGIPEAERIAVFKAFTRLDDSRNRDTGGHGLGLAIVKRIAGLHGGDISVGDSDDLGGARFVLSWPAAGAQASSA